MPELLLPRLKQEIEARLEELRPIMAEVEQLEAAKAALLAGSAGGAAAGGASTRRADGGARPAADGGRAPRGANREAILRLVEERPGVSVAEIAAVTRIAKPTVATTVSKLKREGVLADEAGGVKLASRQPVTLAAVAGAAAAPTSAGDGAAGGADPRGEGAAAAGREGAGAADGDPVDAA